MKVKVTRSIVIKPNQTSSVYYLRGWQGTAPREHIEKIVAAGAGERLPK
jgi:hypothetical protein